MGAIQKRNKHLGFLFQGAYFNIIDVLLLI